MKPNSLLASPGRKGFLRRCRDACRRFSSSIPSIVDERHSPIELQTDETACLRALTLACMSNFGFLQTVDEAPSFASLSCPWQAVRPRRMPLNLVSEIRDLISLTGYHSDASLHDNNVVGLSSNIPQRNRHSSSGKLPA